MKNSSHIKPTYADGPKKSVSIAATVFAALFISLVFFLVIDAAFRSTGL